MVVPHGRVVTRGLDALATVMRDEAPARRLDGVGRAADADRLRRRVRLPDPRRRRHPRRRCPRGDDPRGPHRPALPDLRWQLGRRDPASGPRVHRRARRTPVMTAVDAAPEVALEEGGGVMERLFESLLGSLELATVHLGSQLGLYAALDHPRTAAELADETGIDERYAREWLEQQAISGLVDVAEPGDTRTRRYVTSPGQHLALADSDVPGVRRFDGAPARRWSAPSSRGCRRPTAPGPASASASTATRSVSARGCSTGAPSSTSSPRSGCRRCPASPQLLAREGASAVDLGCGVGWSGVALASAYPQLSVLGVDSDDASIMDARAHAAAAGLGDRVRFEVADADTDLGEGRHDVAFFFEALHDMAHPVEALVAARRTLRPGGRGGGDGRARRGGVRARWPTDRAAARRLERAALPAGRSLSGRLGRDRRPVPTARCCGTTHSTPGTRDVEVVPIEHDLFRFYVLTP